MKLHTLKIRLLKDPKFRKVWIKSRRSVAYYKKTKHKHVWGNFLGAYEKTDNGYKEIPLADMCEKCEKVRKVSPLA